MYNELFDTLEDMGAEVEDTIERLMGDEEMYVKYLVKLSQNENIKNLRIAVDEGDLKKAEAEVHALKGISLNLGLLPLTDVCMDMLLDLRSGQSEHLDEQMEAIEENFQDWTAAVESFSRG